MPLISIIIPVYNSEKTLNRCVNSILNQTFMDWELLLVDDGSTDKSGKICDQYALKDFRIRVFHKKNGGVSSARNTGLDYAIGSWITFVDSDDFIDATFLDTLIRLQSSDLCISGIQFINNETILLPPEEYIKIENVAELDNLLNKLYFTAPWGKVYKNEIIQKNNIRFNINLKIGEDTDFVLKYLLYINDIRLISRPLYHFFNDEKGKITKYTLTADEFITHTISIKTNLTVLCRKLNYTFPITNSVLMKYYSHLFYVYLMSIPSYTTFKKEAWKYKVSHIDYYPKSSRNAFVMKLIKIFPLAVFGLFRLLK
jgi:glycosyltransferase involved in cell wall biosynthesis